jgi:hypothetical protein
VALLDCAASSVVLARSSRRAALDERASSIAAAVKYSYAPWFADALALAYVVEATGALMATTGTLSQRTQDRTSFMTIVKNLQRVSRSHA